MVLIAPLSPEPWHIPLVSFQSAVLEQRSTILKHNWPWTKVKKWPWPWTPMHFHVIMKFTIHTKLSISDFNGCWEMHKSPMLQTKPQGHWAFGSGEEEFWRVFTIYRHDSHFGHVTRTIDTYLLSHEVSIWNFVFFGPAALEQNQYKIFKSKSPWTKVKKWPWPLALIHFHVIIKFNIHIKLYVSDFHGCWEMHYFINFPYKSIRNPSWLYHKMGQCWLRVIIWTNFVGPKSPMLHSKPQGHWTFGSVEEDF